MSWHGHKQMDIEQLRFITVHCVKLCVHSFDIYPFFFLVQTVSTPTFRTCFTQDLKNEAPAKASKAISSI